MTQSIQEAINEANIVSEDATHTDHSAMALLLMDTCWRLASAQLKRENRFRAKDNLPPLVPGLQTLQESMKFVLSFDSHFVEAHEDEQGQMQWVQGNRLNFPSVYYKQMENLTARLVDNIHYLGDTNLQGTAIAVLSERDDENFAIPDTSGGVEVAEFKDEIANKIVYLSTRFASLIRDAGHSTLFNPRSSFTFRDIENACELKLQARPEMGEVDASIDRPMSNAWSINGDLLKPKDVVQLDVVELEKATRLQKALNAWVDVYDAFVHDSREAIKDEVDYMRELTAERVKAMRDQPVVTGVVRAS